MKGILENILNSMKMKTHQNEMSREQCLEENIYHSMAILKKALNGLRIYLKKL